MLSKRIDCKLKNQLFCILYIAAEEILQTQLESMTRETHDPISTTGAKCCVVLKREHTLINKPQLAATYSDTHVDLVYAIESKLRRAIDYLHRSIVEKIYRGVS